MCIDINYQVCKISTAKYRYDNRRKCKKNRILIMTCYRIGGENRRMPPTLPGAISIRIQDKIHGAITVVYSRCVIALD